jgi:glycosyltransferase involved in cell wall biosynthesis
MDRYGEPQDRKAARHTLGLPLDKRIYLFLGTIRRYKGLARLVQAFSRAHMPGALLVVAGKIVAGASWAEIRRQADSDTDRFLLLPGMIPDRRVATFLGAADFVVLPYRKVHMSGTSVLAISYGRPVIAPRMGLIPEYLPEGGRILYDPDDPSGLQRALEHSLHVDAEAMGAEGQRFAVRLSWEEIAERHARFYSLSAQAPDGTFPPDTAGAHRRTKERSREPAPS